MRLHAAVLDLARLQLPGLVVERAHVGDGRPRTGGHDEPGLHLLRVDGCRWKVETHAGTIIAVFGRDQHPIADDQQLLPGKVRFTGFH